LFARALTAGVAFVPGRAFAVPGSTAQHGDAMRLSFSTLTDDELRMAADRLFSVAARMP
jgi:DNA-binding transcriptional MocR family regulator